MTALEFTDKELAAIRAEYCKGATDTQFDLFIAECKARNLYPGRHLVFQIRNAKEWDPVLNASVFVKKPYWITTIAALLLIAEETGKYDGASAPEYIYLDDNNMPSVVSDIPLPDKSNRAVPREPWAVRVKVRRKDFSEPIVSVVRFDSVAATMKRDNKIVLTDMWVKRGPEQNAKCSLANAIRVAFPEWAGQLYLSEEIKNELEEHPVAVTPASVTQVPAPPVVPKVDQTPAQPTNAPRPGEQSVGDRVAQSSTPDFVDKHLGPVPPVDPALAKALAAVPSLKPASELPPPTKKKPGRKPKESPVNGQPTEGGITDADIASAGTPRPEFNEVANQKAAQEFVESVSSFTAEEAVAQGLPEPVDPIPSPAEQKSFAARARALVEPGVDIAAIGAYTLGIGQKTASKFLTISDWTKALTTLEEAKKAGTLKDAVKGAPSGPF